MKKLIMLRFSGEPKYNQNSFGNDTYLLMIKSLIKQKIIDYAYLVYTNNPIKKEQKIQITPQIEARLLNGVETDLKKEKFEYFFLRGNYREFPDFIKQIKFNKVLYYAADSCFEPRAINSKKIDIFFVDEKKYFKDVKKMSPNSLPWILDKPVNEKIFYPKKEKKKYDICYVSNFRPWKNHNIFLNELHKLHGYEKIKVIFVGNLFCAEFEANGLARKYKANVKWTGKMSTQKTASYIRQSKFTIMASELDACPRSIYESIACDVPILINSKITGGIHLINDLTGHKCDLYKFHKGIDFMLKNYNKFNPYQYHKERLTTEKIIKNSFIKSFKKKGWI